MYCKLMLGESATCMACHSGSSVNATTIRRAPARLLLCSAPQCMIRRSWRLLPSSLPGCLDSGVASAPCQTPVCHTHTQRAGPSGLAGRENGRVACSLEQSPAACAPTKESFRGAGRLAEPPPSGQTRSILRSSDLITRHASVHVFISCLSTSAQLEAGVDDWLALWSALCNVYSFMDVGRVKLSALVAS
jgi:hypothetical protein